MTLVNTETGEIAKTPQSVVEFLENSKWALDVAVEMSGPADVANIKAQVVMADTYARELHLSKDIQEQAREMVRRAEYAMGRAIRKGQEDGTVRKYGEHAGATSAYTRVRLGQEQVISPAVREASSKLSPGDFFGSGQEMSETYALAEASPEEFERALEDAKTEGNTSRRNLVRKVKSASADQPLTRQQRADLITDLAEQGYTSHQMADRVGVQAARVREIARAFDIDIHADRAVGRSSQRIDHTAAVEAAVTRLEHLTDALKFIDFAEVDRSETDEWTASLTNSIRALNRFKKQIEETIHVH